MKLQQRTALNELLVLRAQAGEAAAFEALARTVYPRLLRHGNSLLGDPDAARDAVQEAWLGIARGLHRLNDPARFVPWAYRIVANKCRDWLRREQCRRRHTEQDDGAVAKAEAPEEAQHTDPELRLREGLARMGAKRRAILSMHYLDGMSVVAIGEILGIPAGTVKSRLFHARKELRQLLEEDDEA